MHLEVCFEQYVAQFLDICCLLNRIEIVHDFFDQIDVVGANRLQLFILQDIMRLKNGEKICLHVHCIKDWISNILIHLY